MFGYIVNSPLQFMVDYVRLHPEHYLYHACKAGLSLLPEEQRRGDPAPLQQLGDPQQVIPAAEDPVRG